MNRIRLAAAALNQTPLAWDTNAANIRGALRAARDAGAGIVCLPELCVTGYGCEDMFFSAGVEQTALELIRQLVPETTGLVATLGVPVRFEEAVYNAVAIACDGRLLGLVAKQHLAGDGIHYEPRWFHRWPAGKVAAVEVGGQEFPLGDLLFECGGVRIGMEICRDAWVADRTGTQLARRGADVILNPSASHFAFGKQAIRERLVTEGSRAFCASYAYSNLLGNEAGRAIYDGGTLIASGGQMLADGPRFSFADWLLSTTVVDVDATRHAWAEVFDKQPVDDDSAETSIVRADFTWPEISEAAGEVTIATGTATDPDDTPLGRIPGDDQWDSDPQLKEEEFARAVPLALFDYLRKSRSRGMVISLSGGADSSSVAVLVHLLVQLAGRELGPRRLAAKLAHIESLADIGAAEEFTDGLSRAIVGKLLACVYQSTCNSSPTTRDAARTVAEAIGAEFIEWNVDVQVDGYVETVAAAVGRELTWEADDLALQNIQARARAPGVWLLTNLRGALLLATSNRSEAAVGYATMDGDTCGGLAPLAGIDKAFLRDWLAWFESTGPAGIGPLPRLAVVTSQTPTAELRPATADQTDEGDLMPYRVLDAIERSAIRDKFSPVEVFEATRPQFPQYDLQLLGTWVERFFRLWCRNQWKRERYAPSFHLDDENLDPKTWCRFPILNSGFERELEELRRHLGTLA